MNVTRTIQAKRTGGVTYVRIGKMEFEFKTLDNAMDFRQFGSGNGIVTVDEIFARMAVSRVLQASPTGADLSSIQNVPITFNDAIANIVRFG